MATMLDDLGHQMTLTGPARRVVSLVPSLTEAIAVSAPGRLVGATDWCTHPVDLDVTRVRGTKNPDRAAITRLEPDLVVANQEENRKLDVERLRAEGVAVWVTVTESVPQAVESMRRLFAGPLGMAEPSWLTEAADTWSRPWVGPRRTVAVPIWRDPWMVVGSRTFTGDLLARMGLDNVFGDHEERYPAVTVAEILQRSPELVLLPDEPYVFTADDGPEAFRPRAAAGMPAARTVLVPGRMLTWYGPSLTQARDVLLDLLGAPSIAEEGMRHG